MDTKTAACLLILSLLHTIKDVVGITSNKTVTSYDPAELLAKIFKPNITGESRQRGYGFVKFDDQDPGIDPAYQAPGQYGLIGPERDQRPLRFEDDNDAQNNFNDNYETSENGYLNGNRPLKFQDPENGQGLAFDNGGVKFQDDNKVDNQGIKKKRKRRRRRKPKNGVVPHYPGGDAGLLPGRPGFQRPLEDGYGIYPYGNQGYPGTQPFRRPRRRRPRPTIASEALSSITEALTSIARYDDYQCVPRLLCEAAGGGALANNGVLQSIAGIQPLLTLLSVYNGISTSPLFVFGRAVFLGMTAKGNPGTCRYAYPQCPTDPEELIHYLNNHNGGFFRFFSAPQLPNQNLEQFYNQLGQDYGIYNPSAGQNYGFPNNPNSGQNYGSYLNNQNQGYPGAYEGQNHGNYGLQKPGPYERLGLYNTDNSGSNYAYDYNNYGSANQIRFKENKIEKRIQNKPTQNIADDSFEDDNVKTKWQFPDDTPDNVNTGHYNIRDSRTLKFPESGQSYNSQKYSNRNDKQLLFPENQNNHNNNQPSFTNNNRYQTTTSSYNNVYNNVQNNQNYHSNKLNNNYKYQATKYHNYDYNPNHTNNDNYQNNQNYYNNRQNIYNNNNKYPTTTFNNEDYVFDHKHNFYVKKEKSFVNNDKKYNNYSMRNEDDGLNTVYVVRGNGDPNKPEIVKLRPGQSVY